MNHHNLNYSSTDINLNGYFHFNKVPSSGVIVNKLKDLINRVNSEHSLTPLKFDLQSSAVNLINGKPITINFSENKNLTIKLS